MHESVLKNEVLEYLNVQPNDTVLDATVGGGGHSEAICKSVDGELTLIGLDLDEQTLEETALKLAPCKPRLVVANFRDIDQVMQEAGIRQIDRALFDLGQSSMQIDESGRGFSFQGDERLLMTFKSRLSDDDVTAETIVNDWSLDSIEEILDGFADEKFAEKIANAIGEARREKRITRTSELVSIIEEAVPYWYRKQRRHPATKTFQALRMAVNDEFGAVKEGLSKTFSLLTPGGRLAVITFESITDREVKRYFRALSDNGEAELITRKAVHPSREEINNNKRARSALLRVIEKK